MDDWDIPSGRQRLRGGDVPLCDLTPRPALHQLGSLVYVSQFRRTRTGTPFSGIKQSVDIAGIFAREAISFIRRLINNTQGWALITTPRRRHHDGFHFASHVCSVISGALGIPFHENAVQCVNRCRLDPEFHLLLPFDERNVIVYDDIITTGSTLKATADLLSDRDMVVGIIGINNR